MKRSLAVLGVAFSLSIGAAFAHGGMEHVMGTVKEVSATSLTVTTKAKDVEVRVDGDTRFEGATARELKSGDRVVVHAKRSGDGLHAELVKSRAAAGAGKRAHGEAPTR